MISIGPILAVPGMRDALSSARAPVIAISPFVGGAALKGPTVNCMRAVGAAPSATGVAGLYAGLIDGLIADAGDPQPANADVPVLAIPTLMDDPGSRRALAQRALEFAAGLKA